MAAAELIRKGGPEAATTRAVAAAASVQAPTLYRLIGDKDALLEAVAEFEFAAYVDAKRHVKQHSDPVEALRQGWDAHVSFGLAHPGLFKVISGNARSQSALAGRRALGERVHAIALAGRLRGSEERIVAMLHAACAGVVLALIAEGDTNADLALSHDTREAILARIARDTPSADSGGVQQSATTLRARLSQSRVLSPGERALLDELLLRLSAEP